MITETLGMVPFHVWRITPNSEEEVGVRHHELENPNEQVRQPVQRTEHRWLGVSQMAGPLVPARILVNRPTISFSYRGE